MRWALVAALICASAVAAPSTSTCAQPPSWKRLTTTLIRKIWRPDVDNVVPTPSSTSGGRSGRLAARYGQDIVLRFNVSTAAEAIAIAEASEDLYLDVWEFNEGWVDIRLAKEVVCL
jgi:extracellular matrix protein 14